MSSFELDPAFDLVCFELHAHVIKPVDHVTTSLCLRVCLSATSSCSTRW